VILIREFCLQFNNTFFHKRKVIGEVVYGETIPHMDLPRSTFSLAGLIHLGAIHLVRQSTKRQKSRLDGYKPPVGRGPWMA
jgi:hypothetical protein